MHIKRHFLLFILFNFTFINLANTSELTFLPPYDWSKILKVPPIEHPNEGNQILHFKHKNKPYNLSEPATKFVDDHLKNAKRLESDAEILRFGSDAVTINGAFIELGTNSGRTINFIAALNPTKKIYGFDAFTKGLPTNWERPDKTFEKGTFAYKDRSLLPPPVLDNVLLVDGLFEKTLPLFKQEILKDTPIAFLHIDCDTYLSTKQAFDILGANIVPGTIIVFDEFYNYPNSENHEFKAFYELLKKRNLGYEYLAFNINHEQVVARIK